MLKSLATLIMGVALAAVPVTAKADVIVVEFTGMNLEYIGSTILSVGSDGTLSSGFPASTGDADPLTEVSFYVGADPASAIAAGPVSTFTNDIFIEVEIEDIFNIPVAGGTVTTSDSSAAIDLLLEGGATGALFDLNSGSEIVYDPTGVIDFLFSGTLRIFDQNLPIADSFDSTSEIIVSFSLQADSIAPDANGQFIVGFQASGGGQIQEAFELSEPSVLALLSLGLLGLGFAAHRRRVTSSWA